MDTAENRLMEPQDWEINLKYLYRYIQKKKRIIFLSVLLCALAGLLYALIPYALHTSDAAYMASYEAAFNEQTLRYNTELEETQADIASINSYLSNNLIGKDQPVMVNVDIPNAEGDQWIYYINLNDLLNQKQASLQALKAGGAPQWAYTREILLHQILRYGLIGFVFGLLASVLTVTAYYIASDKILDSEKLRINTRVSIQGLIPPYGGKQGNKADPAREEACNNAVALTAQSILATLEANGVTEGSIALAGTLGMEGLLQTAEAFNKALPDGRLQFAAAGNPLSDTACVEIVKTSAAVLIVERQGVSRCSDVVRENARLIGWGKPLPGAVLLDASM